MGTPDEGQSEEVGCCLQLPTRVSGSEVGGNRVQEIVPGT